MWFKLCYLLHARLEVLLIFNVRFNICSYLKYKVVLNCETKPFIWNSKNIPIIMQEKWLSVFFSRFLWVQWIASGNKICKAFKTTRMSSFKFAGRFINLRIAWQISFAFVLVKWSIWHFWSPLLYLFHSHLFSGWSFRINMKHLTTLLKCGVLLSILWPTPSFWFYSNSKYHILGSENIQCNPLNIK